MSDTAIRTAHAGRLVADALEVAFLPLAGVNVALWAEQHRWVEGAMPGRWDNQRAPYLREPMETIGHEDYLTTVLVGPGQCGKTAIAENALLASIDTDPAPTLWYMQTDDAVRAYVKGTINPLIEAHPEIYAKRGARNSDDSVAFKRFRGMTVQFLPATRSQLINKTARRIVADEWDAYDESFGDPKTQLDVRRQTYGADSHLLAISHPDKARGVDEAGWTAGIMALYRESDRRIWCWPCPHCDGWSSPAPSASRVMRLVYPEGDDVPLDTIAAEARLLCPCCGAHITDDQRRAMNREGFWLRQGQDLAEDGTVTGEALPNKTAGFWIQGVMSPFLLEGIGGLARARVAAERTLAAGGEDKSLREVYVKQWGLPYEPAKRVGTVDAETLVGRADDGLTLGTVPDGVRFLTVMIDVQGDRFERLVVGWGEAAESWVIDFRKISGTPGQSPEDWDNVLQESLAAEYPLADGSGRVMRVLAVGYDSQGVPGVTEQAYNAWRRARAARLTRMTGYSSGRECWTLLPTKGLGTANANRLNVVYPDSQRKDRRAGARGEVPLGVFNANVWKDALAARLGVAEPGPLYVHIPAGLKSPDAPHEWFEQLVAEQRSASGLWSKIAPRNEALDLMVGAHVMAHLHGLSRLDWRRPPVWARPWDQNSLVGAPSMKAETVVVQYPADTVPAPAPPARPGAVAAPGRRGLSETAVRTLSARFARREG